MPQSPPPNGAVAYLLPRALRALPAFSIGHAFITLRFVFDVFDAAALRKQLLRFERLFEDALF